MRSAAITIALVGLAACGRGAHGRTDVRIGSKEFTESVVLSAMATELLADGGVHAVHERGLGGTQILWHALLAGELDAYPEYTGTIAAEILGGVPGEVDSLRPRLAAKGVHMGRPLGFDDGYALAMREEVAARLGITKVSDLRGHPELAVGLSSEFLDRADGWRGLRARYELPQTEVRGMEHALAYRAAESDQVAVIDVYSTDAEIAALHLRVLVDDLGYFPRYQAVFLWREDLERRAPAAVATLVRLEGRIDAPAMIAMNARAKLDRVPEDRVAADFLASALGVTAAPIARGSAAQRILARTAEHLGLVGISLGLAILVGLPLGILAAKRRRLGHALLAAVGVVQTIPSLALLVVLIPLLGIGARPAIVALFLYSLLPIVRNTFAGLTGIPAPLAESAAALGLPAGARLRLIELPLAARTILAGIKTSAVINIGTATLGALIGAGGYGQPIMTGIRLDDTRLILEGAVPAALLALVAQGLFELAERYVLPRGLRAS